MKPNGIAKNKPSNLSSKPPWPGKIFPVSFNFAVLLRNEIKISPICEINEIRNIKIISVWIDTRSLNKTEEIINEKMKEPIIPEYVFLGLIFVSFFPFTIFPTIYPPMSDVIQIDIIKSK